MDGPACERVCVAVTFTFSSSREQEQRCSMQKFQQNMHVMCAPWVESYHGVSFTSVLH